MLLGNVGDDGAVVPKCIRESTWGINANTEQPRHSQRNTVVKHKSTTTHVVGVFYIQHTAIVSNDLHKTEAFCVCVIQEDRSWPASLVK